MKKQTVLFLISFFSFNSLFSQNTVSGYVVDNENDAVVGAAVIFQTTDSTFIAATQTDMSGYFSLTCQQKQYRLIVQHVSYQTFETISDKDSIGVIRLMVNYGWICVST